MYGAFVILEVEITQDFRGSVFSPIFWRCNPFGFISVSFHNQIKGKDYARDYN